MADRELTFFITSNIWRSGSEGRNVPVPSWTMSRRSLRNPSGSERPVRYERPSALWETHGPELPWSESANANAKFVANAKF